MTSTGCKYDEPMTYCTDCGCWMNCKRDGIDLEYRRRPDIDTSEIPETPEEWFATAKLSVPQPKCQAHRVAGTTEYHCVPCQLRWDADDEPPPCGEHP
jgi:hypothetical protein